MQRYELIEGTSAKFWEVDIQGHLLTVRFGRIGTQGQTQTKTLADAAAAQKELAKLVKEKTGKGYAAVGGASTGTLTAVAPKPTAAPTVAATPAPTAAPAATPIPTPVPTPTPSPQPMASIDPSALDWPQGGLQMAAFKRVRMPVVRGWNCPPWQLPAGFWEGVPQVGAEAQEWLGHFSNNLRLTGSMAWSAWPSEAWPDRLSRQRLSQPDQALWQEAWVQCSILAYMDRRSDTWITRACISLHGVAFTLEVLLSTLRLWPKPGILVQATPNIVEELRHAIAAAPEPAYQAARAVAEAESHLAPAPALLTLRLHLFPDDQPWIEEALAQGRAAEPPSLAHSLMSADQLLAYQGRSWFFSDADMLLHLSRHGVALLPLLGQLLARADTRAETEQVLRWVLALRCPEQIGLLVRLMESSNAVRVALETLAEQYPAATLYTAIQHGLATRSRLVQGWALRLGTRHPLALAQALAALEPAQAQAWQQAQQHQSADEAPPEALPELLRSPPWLRPQRPQALPVLALSPLPVPAQVNWTPAQRDQFLRHEKNDWLQKRIARGVKEYGSPEASVLNLLNLRRSSHAAILAGGPMEATDFKDGPSWQGECRCEVLLNIDPATAIHIWNHYPAHRWEPDYGGHQMPCVLLAHLGLAALPGFVAYCESQPVEGLPLARCVDAPGLARVALHALCNLKKAKDAAQRWVLAHLRTSAIVGLQQAFGRDKDLRDSGAFGLRWLMRQGHEALVDQVAAEYGGEVPAALALLKAADPLNVLPARMPKLPTFFAPGTLARPLLRDGLALPLSAVEHIGSMLAISKIDAPYVGLEIVRQHCQGDTLAEFAWDLFQAWLVADAPAKEGWAYTALGLLGNDQTVRRLAPLIRIWPGESAHARAVTGLDLLAAIGTDLALMNLNAIANKVKFKGLQDKAREKIALVAEVKGLSTEELADRLVPDLGLDEQGALTLDFGPRQFTVAFDETLRPFVRDAQGARLKDLPKPVKSDDAALAAAATERYKALKKDAKAIASMQITRLELGMVNQRRWSAADFALFFVQHPLMRFLSARLVWGVYQEGVLTEAFRVAEDGTLANRHDDLYTLADDATVGIAHVLELPADVQTDFGQILADYDILQPFPQLGREVYTLTAEELDNNEVKRFAGKTVSSGSILGLVNRGWQRGQAQDAGWVGWFLKPVGHDLEITASLEPGLIVGDTSFEPKQVVQSLGLSVANVWGDGQAQPLSQLNPITASEMLRDIDLLAPYQESK